MPHRYFTNEIGQGVAAVTGADAHHLARVMRAKIGDEIILCGENALEYTARITDFGEDRVECSIGEGLPSVAEPDIAVTLLVGYPKQDKLEQVIKHGVELGAVGVVPFFSRYCVAAPKKEEQKNVRYNRIALEAAKQSGRGRVPSVAMPVLNFGALCRSFGEYDLVLLCYEGGGVPLQKLVQDAVQQHAAKGTPLRVALITGAEGGFSPEEVAAATEAGAQIIGLGPRILRCETAPLAALSAIMAYTQNLE